MLDLTHVPLTKRNRLSSRNFIGNGKEIGIEETISRDFTVHVVLALID